MNYTRGIEEYGRCECGAITFFHENGMTYSIARKNLKGFIPGIDLRKIRRLKLISYCCDHCVNHYGLDLCACGSGQPFWECDNGYPECGQPMQVLGERARYAAPGSWLAG